MLFPPALMSHTIDRYLGSASPWAFPMRRSCSKTRAAKRTPENPFSNSAWTICRRPNKASPSSASFSPRIPIAASWPLAAAIRITENSTAAWRIRFEFSNAALDAGARAVDIEIESAENAIPRLEALRGKGQLMLSYHNYDGTPSPETVLRRMLRISADGYKIVTTARKPSDNSRILALTKSHSRTPLIVLAMGETGFPTRVLSTAWGGMFTYAAPNASEGTASGQVSARVLRHLYRVEKFSRAAKIYGVIADPVRHSISPAVHNRAFQAHRLDAVYLPFLVQPAQLKDFFILAESLPVAGFSVTIPHKQKIVRYLDVIDPLARRIGAVNTVWKKAGQVAGREYRCRCGHGSVVPQAAFVEIVGAGGRQRRRRSQRGVCAGR